MQYTSTRNQEVSVNASFAIANGISKEGGLFVPTEIPSVSQDFIAALAGLDYSQRAVEILKLFLPDYPLADLEQAVKKAYLNGSFEQDQPAPLSDLSDDRFVLELWHGPTCAFKDMALQLLPGLMASAAARVLEGKEILILVATSGDTGKAALEGFCDKEGTSIAVFYPDQGVSAMQRLQMASQKGENVAVYAIHGNFDDAQSQVKSIFTNEAVIEALAQQNRVLSSANSINWGRLVPQIVYYFSAYSDLLKEEKITLGEQVNFSVPTGNFGNILAGYYAMKMGLPVHKLICASNKNNVLTDFMQSGVYDANRAFHVTTSPSMDILISSNLERLLYHLCSDSAQVADWMQALAKDRKYTVPAQLRQALDEHFYGVYLDDAASKEVIGRIWQSHGYLLDPHTAVALGAQELYQRETSDQTKTIIVSTASPYKFAPAVLEALAVTEAGDEFAQNDCLAKTTGTAVPQPIEQLKTARTRFTTVVAPNEMATEVLRFAKGA